MKLILFVKEAWALAVKRHRENDRRRRMYAAARAFNDLHCHTSRTGRWMCPDCNNIHDALPEVSVFTGLQYPRCCRYAEGHRLHEDWHATTCRTSP
jgi:hypothetical protein